MNVWRGGYFSIWNVLKEGEASLPLLLNLASEYSIRKIQVNRRI
jgi:hypothetical protein